MNRFESIFQAKLSQHCPTPASWMWILCGFLMSLWHRTEFIWVDIWRRHLGDIFPQFLTSDGPNNSSIREKKINGLVDDKVIFCWDLDVSVLFVFLKHRLFFLIFLCYFFVFISMADEMTCPLRPISEDTVIQFGVVTKEWMLLRSTNTTFEMGKARASVTFLSKELSPD